MNTGGCVTGKRQHNANMLLLLLLLWWWWWVERRVHAHRDRAKRETFELVFVERNYSCE
jgi:hypothetical protein